MHQKLHIRKLFPLYICVLLVLLLLAYGGSRIVTVMTENAPVENRKCVVIDAGHGGVDGGATSRSGILESQINLEISLRARDLMHILGIKTVLIRDTDRSVYTAGNTIAQKKISDLKQRVKIINECHNATLLSIHQNHFTESRYSGAQVFYTDDQNSIILADKLQSALNSSLCLGSKRVHKKASGIYIMEKINTPGILLECGFISNAEEEGRLLDSGYQKKLCVVIASVFSQYLHGTVS